MSARRQVVVQQFWATNFYAFQWPEHEQESSAIIEFVYQTQREQGKNIASGIAPGAKPAQGLYESGFDLLDQDHPGLRKLKAFICECVQEAVVHVNSIKADPRQLRVEIRDSWFHVTKSGGFHDTHVHGGCSWCGIYYLQIGESGRQDESGAPNGGSRFYSPLWTGGGYQDFGNNYLTHAYVDPPLVNGMVLLFPSYLLHSGLPYHGETDRIVIAFNTRTFPASQRKS